MNFLILFLLTSTISISKINGEKNCTEQKCSSGSSEWCCPYNTICANQNTCSSRPSSYCQDTDHKCSVGGYYWCCDKDQTCGRFNRCNRGSSPNTAEFYVGTAFVFLIVIIFSGWCIRYQCSNEPNTFRTIFQPSDNQGGQRPVNRLMNNSNTQANSSGQVYNIGMPSATNLNKEKHLPIYEAAMTSSTTQNQNKI